MTTSHSTAERAVDTARAIARETGWRLEQDAGDREWTAMGVGPVGQSRDSDALERSNFRTIYSDLSERFGESVDILRFGHWAVGWVEEIGFDAGNADVVAAVEQWASALADYPVADEMDFCELEWEDAHPDDGLCYSEDPDWPCGCERA